MAPTINRVNDDNGTVEMSVVAKGREEFKKSMLDSKDCFVVDLVYSIYIWIGSGSTKTEKREAMKYAVRYCMDSGRSTNIPIVRVNEGNETEEFLSAFDEEESANDDEKEKETENEEIDYAEQNVKRHWDLGISFDAKNRQIVLRVTDKVTKQRFGRDIKKEDVDGKDIVSAYKEIANAVNGGEVKYTFIDNPPLIVDIGQYNFSCPAFL